MRRPRSTRRSRPRWRSTAPTRRSSCCRSPATSFRATRSTWRRPSRCTSRSAPTPEPGDTPGEIRGSTTIVEILRMYPNGEAGRLMSQLAWPCAHCGGAFREPLTLAAKRHGNDPRAALDGVPRARGRRPDARAGRRGTTQGRAVSTTAARTFVGQAVPRVEDEALLRGQGRFMDDIDPVPHARHAAIVRSPFAHARISSIDVSAALELPGVVGVVTADGDRRRCRARCRRASRTAPPTTPPRTVRRATWASRSRSSSPSRATSPRTRPSS